jgi:pyruvate-ferredoxin/flavodoxin oxidoreductase
MNPEHPHVRGAILPAELFWQAAEKPNKLYGSIPDEVNGIMQKYGKLTGRYYKPFEYFGPKDAKSVVVLMAASCGTVAEYVKEHADKKIGVIKVHLYRPFSPKYLKDILPDTVEKICILDKARDFAGREALYTDVVSALAPTGRKIKYIGGRYGLGSKDFAPNHVQAVFKNLLSENPVDDFTVGLSGGDNALPIGEAFDYLPKSTRQCIFWGLGADGTVGSNKEAIKIIVDNTELHGQAHFAYSAHKSGGLTMSHVRFGSEPLDASYCVQQADYVACHFTGYVKKLNMIKQLKKGGTFVLNCPEGSDLDKLLPNSMRKGLADKEAVLYVIDANKIANECGLPGRINMIMQSVFFGLSGVMPADKCVALLKKSIEQVYLRKGKEVIEKNWQMVDNSLQGVHKVNYDKAKWSALVPEVIPEAKGYDKLIQKTIQNRADEITVAEFPEIGAIPPGTSKKEKRGIAVKVPKWHEDKCVQCNLCGYMCPHAVIRPFLLTKEETKGLKALKAKGKEFKDLLFRIQISPYNCTGCAVCVNACPADALSMVDAVPMLGPEDKNWDICMAAPNRAHLVKPTNVKNVTFRTPLLEFSGACSGCGEPAMIKLVTQLYGDQLYFANAAGCTVVWASSTPFNPYTINEFGHGPTWGFSLFEDNAQYGYGMYQSVKARRLNVLPLIQKIIDGQHPQALKDLLKKLLTVWEDDESAEVTRKIQEELKKCPQTEEIKELISQQDVLAKKTVWILGGDGWAYDIGFGGLDHVLASGEDVNVLVLDTEVYSNTGGQCSKATPRGAIANFSAAGYAKMKKDLGAIMITYGNIYVAMTSHLADPEHALKCIKEAKEYKGPSLVINYAPCISHGIKAGLAHTPKHAKNLLDAGYNILYRYDPRRRAEGKNPFQLDSKKPSFDVTAVLEGENRYAALKEIYPKEAEVKYPLLVEDLKKRYNYYVNLTK